MPFHITPSTPDDARTIVEYNIALAAETECKSLNRATVQKGVRAVLNDSAKGRYFVARLSEGEEAGVVIGQLMVTFEWSDWRNGMMWWVQSVYVRSDWRRKGVFRALFQHVVEQAQRESVPCVRLYVEEHNASARETYASLGLEPTGYLVLERIM
jgi:GNAT superfamily N-acetyltransferase